MRQRTPRRDRGQIRFTDRDESVLRWIAAHGMARLDQIGQLLGGTTPVTRGTRDAWLRRMLCLGYVHDQRLRNEPRYVWLSDAGRRALGLDLPVWTPLPPRLPALYWSSEWARQQRLTPGDDWLPWFLLCAERRIAPDDPAALQLPDGQFETQAVIAVPPGLDDSVLWHRLQRLTPRPGRYILVAPMAAWDSALRLLARLPPGSAQVQAIAQPA